MRLIDADALIERLKYSFRSNERVSMETVTGCFLDETGCAPTIDAVPVVRCWECKHRYTENCPMYFHDSYWHEGYEEYVDDDTDHTEDDYFCPKGEQKEGAD